MVALHQGSRDNLEVAPNLWAGFGLVRGGAGTALVGSHRRWRNASRNTLDLGITEFVLSGVPHLEEAYWFGEGVLPLLHGERVYGRIRAEQRVGRVKVTNDVPSCRQPDPTAIRQSQMTAPPTHRFSAGANRSPKNCAIFGRGGF